MSINYHNLAKKSIFIFGFLVFLLSAVSVSAKVPNDEGYEKQKEMWEIIKAPQAWEYSTGLEHEVVVAIIDIGVDIYHSELKQNIWKNVYEIPKNGKDDDKNGFVDDVNGWNFVSDDNKVRPSVIGEGLDKGIISHGTIAAGLIGAVGDNKIGGVGVNWNVKIMPIVAITSKGTGSYTNVVKAINYAVDNGAQVINLSFTSDLTSDALKNAIYNAYQKGVVVVSAGGNELHDLSAKPVYPVCLDQGDEENWVLGVGAMTNGKYLTNFSNFGDCIDVYAPGEDIYSTQRYAPQFGFKDKFGGPWQGTSFATPLVTGAVSLVKSIRPNWSADKIIATVLKRSDLTKKQREESAGIALNLENAVKVATEDNSEKLNLIYYFNERGVVYKNRRGDKREYITKIINGEIIDLKSKNISGDVDPELVLLYKIGDFYFIKIMNKDNHILREFSVKGLSKDVNLKTIKFEKDQKGNDHILLTDGVEEYGYSFAGAIVKK